MSGGLPARLLFVAIVALAGCIVMSAYAGRVFLACAAVATWRLWRVAHGAPLSAPPRARQPGQREKTVPGVVRAPIRAPRSLEQAMAELDGMIGLAGVKDEIGKLVDVLQAERERAKLGHRTEGV